MEDNHEIWKLSKELSKMGEYQLIEGSLRVEAPAVYDRMIETFSRYNIHPYDAQGAVIKKEEGIEIVLKFSNGFSKTVQTHISADQAKNPDDEVTLFFERAADECKNQLIADYYKMIKL